MKDADTPPTQPADFLVPPTKIPRTALAVATPPPPREPRVPDTHLTFSGVVNEVFDKVDAVADAIAAGLGLRPR
ncbi:MAG TPA: hypothetical protein VGM82_22810 [Gemmatimonadaceae bacterium]|jgi:hypothetical protein